MAQVNSPQDRISNIHKDYSFVYGILTGIVLVLIAIWIGSTIFSDTEGYLTNVFTEIISVIATIFVIDRINQWRADQRLKDDLLSDLYSKNNNIVLDALRRLREKSWLDKDYPSYKNFEGANWEGAYIGDLNFERACLDGANFKRVTNLINNHPMKVNLKDASLVGANLEGAQLRTANFEHAKLNQSKLECANLWGANLSYASLEGANLKQAQLEAARFKYTNLSGVNLSGANIYRAEFQNVIWVELTYGTPIFEAILPDGTKWTEETELERFTFHKHPEFVDTLKKINQLQKELLGK